MKKVVNEVVSEYNIGGNISRKGDNMEIGRNGGGGKNSPR